MKTRFLILSFAMLYGAVSAYMVHARSEKGEEININKQGQVYNMENRVFPVCAYKGVCHKLVLPGREKNVCPQRPFTSEESKKRALAVM